MNVHGGEKYTSPCCSFHPKERVVGICALCLRERLLDLASKHHDYIPNKETSSRRPFGTALARKTTTSISLPRVFALGSFLRLDTRRPHDDSDDRGSIASLDDSFISIKFDDGETSWESRKKKEEDSAAANIRRQQGKALMEHPKPRPASLRWRRRMDQLLQLVRWKRTSATTSHVAMAAKSEAGRRRRKRWIMGSLTATRRTRE
ncbi:uncharacterized protein M6B38_274515 [Iris pallida]|uniref:Uncharacterized protein n=1 Tax=Iris pallida TaxID=29817 RepID=A0AAX6I600_IRIPA|nr:uncharacterized protein M6B38_274515 [Iris pallida]